MFLLIASTFSVAVGSGSRINGKIAFQSRRDGNWQIYVMNADGSEETRLTNNNYNDMTPDWSPVGTEIVFMSDRDGYWEIYVMNADASGQTRLTNNNYADEYPRWSPDGTKIAFYSDRDGNREIYVMNTDGSGQTRLTNNNADDEYADWSPDGTKIIFSSARDGNWEIYVMNSDGSAQTRLTNNNSYDTRPCWSPDGIKILFQSDRDGNAQIYVMNADGSGQTRLTNNNAADVCPRWSPDGTKIAFQSNRDGNAEIYVMNADGSGQTRLTYNSASDYWPFWQSLYLTNFQQIGIGSDFTGNVLNVDNSSYTINQLPASVPWSPGTSHNYSWSSPLTVSDGKCYVWSSTSGLSTEKSGTFIATSKNDSIIANYATQYYVRFQTSTGGSIAQSSKWYNASSAVAISALPSTGYKFTNWTFVGNVLIGNAASQNTTLTVNGAGNVTAIFADMSAPQVGTPSLNPSRNSVQPNQNVKVSVNVTDLESGVKNVTLIYSLDNGTTWRNPESMTLNTTSGLYEGTILGQPIATAVRFKILAFDNAENNVTKDGATSDYRYTVVPEFSSIIVLCIFMIVTMLLAIVYERLLLQEVKFLW